MTTTGTSKKQYAVEEILAMRTLHGHEEFLIKWKHYSDDDNSWEPRDNLKCGRLLASFKRKYRINDSTSKGIPYPKKAPVHAKADLPGPSMIRTDDYFTHPSRSSRILSKNAIQPQPKAHPDGRYLCPSKAERQSINAAHRQAIVSKGPITDIGQPSVTAQLALSKQVGKSNLLKPLDKLTNC